MVGQFRTSVQKMAPIPQKSYFQTANYDQKKKNWARERIGGKFRGL